MSRMDYYEGGYAGGDRDRVREKEAAASGNINEAQNTGKHVKVSKTGISGSGAAALFGKTYAGSFRQSRLGFLTFTSVIIVISSIVVMYMTGGTDDGPADPDVDADIPDRDRTGAAGDVYTLYLYDTGIFV